MAEQAERDHPVLRHKLNGDIEMTNKIRGYTSSVLGLNYIEVKPETN